jgi:hypothetical protein
LFLNRGDGEFAEIGWFAGVTATDWTWTPMFLDVDLDGHEDLLMATGHELRMMDADIGERAENLRRRGGLSRSEIQRLKLLYPRHNVPNVALRNQGDLSFTDASALWRFDRPLVSTGMAAADLDNDGDLDLVLNNLNDPAALLRNDAMAPRILVRLRGESPNTRGIGALIRVSSRAGTQSQEMTSGGRYLSSDEPVRAFAARDVRDLGIEVRWRSGKVTRVTRAQPNHLYEVLETSSTERGLQSRTNGRPLFVDITPVLGHEHVDAPFDDFALQPLLPSRLSRQGPGVVWCDLDHDGADDLVIGAGRGGRPAAFRYKASTFQSWSWPQASEPVSQDCHGLVAWPETNGTMSILAAVAGWEGSPEFAAVKMFAPGRGAESFFSHADAAPGPLASGDFDGDGDLDLFVGGGPVPRRFPEAARSFLLLNNSGVLQVYSRSRDLFEELGLVAAATWADMDDDGFAELVLACSWGSLRVYANNRGQLAPRRVPLRWSSPLGQGRPPPPSQLSDLTGCWTGVAAVDLDGDGQLDIVAGNWGRNSSWELAGGWPLRLYFGDYDGNGNIEVLEAIHVPELAADAPLRSLRAISTAIPFVRERASNHAAYGRLTVAELMGTRMAETRRVEAATLESVVLLNRGDHFEAHPLPPQAQWAPVFAIVPGDFDGDGNEDLFLSQNFFAVREDASRLDAGRGLLLRGDGRGGLAPVSGSESGLRIHGEQRGAATADFDQDGRADLVVTQNGGPTRIFRNQGASSGVRLRLQGPPGNPAGAGSCVRWRKGTAAGPARLVDGGSGWFSQNSPVQVLSAPEPPFELEVRWPGGAVTHKRVESFLPEIILNSSEEPHAEGNSP